MPTLIDLHNEMLKAAAEEVSQPEEKEEIKEAEAKTEDAEEIAKYAELADSLLTEEYGDDYNEEDIAKLAHALKEHDENLLDEQMAKVAEAHQLGVIQARAFAAELNNIQNTEE